MKSGYRTRIGLALSLAALLLVAWGLKYAATQTATTETVTTQAAGGQGAVTQATPNDVKSLFEARYQAWREWIRQETNPWSSYQERRVLFDNEPFRQIVELGIPAVPYMMQKVEKDDLIGYALYTVTKFKWHESHVLVKPGEEIWSVEEFPDIPPSGHPLDARVLWVRWWEEGRQQTPQWFEKLYSEWQDLTRRGEAEEATQKYQRIIDLGISALPCIVKKVEEGQTDLVPAMSVLTNGAISEQAKPAACLDWWNKNKQKWTLPPVKSETVSSTP